MLMVNNMRRSCFFIQSMKEMYSGGESIKAKNFSIKIVQEQLKKTVCGKMLKAKFLTIVNVQERLIKLVVVKR